MNIDDYTLSELEKMWGITRTEGDPEPPRMYMSPPREYYGMRHTKKEVDDAMKWLDENLSKLGV